MSYVPKTTSIDRAELLMDLDAAETEIARLHRAAAAVILDL